MTRAATADTGITERGSPATARRIVCIAGAGFATALALSGITVILPLYATSRLGLSTADFARVLSLRMAGITVGVIVLGAVSDRFGPRRLTAASMALGGSLFAALGFVPLAGFLILVPLVSALLSTAFVNLNNLTQVADPERPGRANTWYRATGTVAGMLAPILTTRFLHSVEWVFLGIGAAMALGGLVLRAYPLREAPEAFQGWSAECRGMAGTYRTVLLQPRLMSMLHQLLLWTAITTAVGAFAAIRITQELHASTAAYGDACALSSALTLAGIVLVGLVIDRVPAPSCTAALFAVSAVALLGLGFARTVPLSLGCLVVYHVAAGSSVGPMSMWLAQAGTGVGLSAVFSVHKVLTAAYGAAASFLLAALEPWLGIPAVFLICGVAALGVVAWMALPRRLVPEAMDVREGESTP
jgi:MFS family permease